MTHLATLIRSGQTIFTIPFAQLLLGQQDPHYTRLILFRLKKTQAIIQLAPGVFAFPHYDPREMASKLSMFSYISCESILQSCGAIFQHYDHTITMIWTNTMTKHCWPYTIQYHKIKESILTNPLWLITKNTGTMIASPERALCDHVYLTKTHHIDNSAVFNWSLVEELATLYPHTTRLALHHIRHAWSTSS